MWSRVGASQRCCSGTFNGPWDPNTACDGGHGGFFVFFPGSVWSGLGFLQRVQLLDVRMWQKCSSAFQKSLIHTPSPGVCSNSVYCRKSGDILQEFLNKRMKNAWTLCSLEAVAQLKLSSVSWMICQKHGCNKVSIHQAQLCSALLCSCFPLRLLSSCQTLRGIQQWGHTVACLKAMIS